MTKTTRMIRRRCKSSHVFTRFWGLSCWGEPKVTWPPSSLIKLKWMSCLGCLLCRWSYTVKFWLWEESLRQTMELVDLAKFSWRVYTMFWCRFVSWSITRTCLMVLKILTHKMSLGSILLKTLLNYNSLIAFWLKWKTKENKLWSSLASQLCLTSWKTSVLWEVTSFVDWMEALTLMKEKDRSLSFPLLVLQI